MIVYKFGGTSVADAQRIRHAASLVAECEGPRVVVVSALAGVTTELVQLASELVAEDRDQVSRRLQEMATRHLDVARNLLPESSDLVRLTGTIRSIMARLSDVAGDGGPRGDPDWNLRMGDAVSAVGEDLSAETMAAALRHRGLSAEAVDAREVVRTDSRFGGAIPRDEETAELVRARLGPMLAQGKVPVLQGFVGATADGVTTTLGRGGSDFTAAIVGAALGADDLSIWTDVDGVLSAEPQYVPGARVLSEMGYEEAVELAYFGARVIHPAAAKHAAARNVSLRVRNTQRPHHPGTLIRHDIRRVAGVAAVAFKPGVTMVRIRSRPMFMAYGFLARVFDVLARHRVPVDLVATSHTSTAFTLDENQGLDAVREELAEFAEVEIQRDLVTVSVVGQGLLQQPGIAARVFSALGQTPVLLISQASDVCLSFLVGSAEAIDVVRRLHGELIENVRGVT
jgi:aspartate kinase